MAFHGKTQEFVVVGQIGKFCESLNSREKFTALIMSYFDLKLHILVSFVTVFIFD